MIIDSNDNINVHALSQVECAKHGVHDVQFVTVASPDASRTYGFCGQCFGEWLAETFPVAAV